MEFDITSAVERLDRMVIRIEAEVRKAIRTERALECANRVVTENIPAETVLPGGDSYSFVRLCMETALSISVAKLFEQPRPQRRNGKLETLSERYHRSDIASIPICAWVLAFDGVRDELIARSQPWYAETCAHDIDEALAAFSRCQKGGDREVDLDMIKGFRDTYLTHLYWNDRPEIVPKYIELFRLVDVARDFIVHARRAVTFRENTLGDYEETHDREFEAFWRPALLAASGLGGGDR